VLPSLLALVTASMGTACGTDNRFDGGVVGPSPQSGVIAPCDPALIDAWSFDVRSGDDVFIAVDTTSALTAADMEIRGICDGKDRFFGDDDFLCTFPPPQFSCPAAAFVASARSTCTVDVSPALASLDPPTGSCTDTLRAEYSVSVLVNGQPAVIALVREGVDQVCIGGSHNGRSCDSDRDCPDGACVSNTGLSVFAPDQKLP
jgi:hypothetical protein